MKDYSFYFKFIFAILLSWLLISSIAAQSPVVKSTQTPSDFANQRKISYIDIGADAARSSFRQRQTILSVYELMNIFAKRQALAIAKTVEAVK